jgi:RNA polymerase sigma-70 factor (ECF subfamily)
LCATFLYKSYPRLMRPPAKLETDELLGGIVAGLIMALHTASPPTVRQFFALAKTSDLCATLSNRQSQPAP